MRDFLDLVGKSGASYRFRRWPEREPHQPIAGNYVLVREAEGGGVELLALGATNDLSLLRKNLTSAHTGQDTHVFTRLNVARGAREAEHEDLAAAYPKAKPARGMGA